MCQENPDKAQEQRNQDEREKEGMEIEKLKELQQKVREIQDIWLFNFKLTKIKFLKEHKALITLLKRLIENIISI